MVGVRTSQNARWPECTEGMAEMGVKATRCQKMEGDPFNGAFDKDMIIPYCTVEKNSFIELTSGNKGTKALINNTSVPDEILCNFLRIDESSAGEFESPSYSTDWLGGKSYISEGDISTISKDICKCI